MSDINIIVEGSTEQTFIREILAPNFGHSNIFLNPYRIGKPGHKGGDIRFERFKNDFHCCLSQRSDTYISTMFDFFRISNKWPGYDQITPNMSAIQKAEKIEHATLQKLVELFPDDNIKNRFIPYIEMHEFEALLFSDSAVLSEQLDVKQSEIDQIITECTEPEEINENPETAPFRRIEKLYKGYRKVAMGTSISEAIGLQTIRQQCPHFNNWIIKMEGK